MKNASKIKWFLCLFFLFYSSVYGQIYSDSSSVLFGIKGKQGIIIDHGFFVLNYCPEWKTSYWSAEHLRLSNFTKHVGRSNVFYPDADLPGNLRSTNSDYSGTGMDRGHITCAGDWAFSRASSNATFVLSNMAPQEPNSNRKCWRILEESIRDSVMKIKGEAWVVTGLLVSPNHRSIGKHKIAVPDYYYKAVLLLHKNGEYSALAALGENVAKGATVTYVATDSVESLSGFDFWPLLPDSVEDAVETTR